MNCNESVDDDCDVWELPQKLIPPPGDDTVGDQFFISLEIETLTFPSGYEEEEDWISMVEVEGKDVFSFWAPCPRVERQNLTKERIAEMLTRAGVPGHKQDFMVETISNQADKMANSAWNKERRVLAMKVSISIVACLCHGESVEDA